MTALVSGVEDGIEWAVCRAPLYGAVNGYVRIPDGHPWSGLDYDAIDVRVHGGLTFARDGWIGFDTLHAGDYWPGMPDWVRNGGLEWDQAMVEEEAKSLARQVAAATTGPKVGESRG